MTVRVVADSGCDLPIQLCSELDVDVVPLTVRFGDEAFTDRVDLTPASFWERCSKISGLPETAAPSPGAFAEAFRKAKADGHEGVVVVTLSSKLSATIQAAQLGVEQVAGEVDVRVVDSKNASLGEGMPVVLAARAAKAGASLDEVERIARSAADRSRLFAAIDTLENLKRGGRIGGAQAMLGGLLSIKPLITVVDGEVHEAGKQRTRGKAVATLVDKVRALGPVEALGVMHAEAPDVGEVVDKLTDLVPKQDIVLADVGPVIGTHIGPRCIGIVAVLKA